MNFAPRELIVLQETENIKYTVVETEKRSAYREMWRTKYVRQFSAST